MGAYYLLPTEMLTVLSQSKFRRDAITWYANKANVEFVLIDFCLLAPVVDSSTQPRFYLSILPHPNHIISMSLSHAAALIKSSIEDYMKSILEGVAGVEDYEAWGKGFCTRLVRHRSLLLLSIHSINDLNIRRNSTKFEVPTPRSIPRSNCTWSRFAAPSRNSTVRPGALGEALFSPLLLYLILPLSSMTPPRRLPNTVRFVERHANSERPVDKLNTTSYIEKPRLASYR